MIDIWDTVDSIAAAIYSKPNGISQTSKDNPESNLGLISRTFGTLIQFSKYFIFFVKPWNKGTPQKTLPIKNDVM
jgi:hypothetical protein